jgi:RNA polymerase sigma-70 factor (ECF subfamily)
MDGPLAVGPRTPSLVLGPAAGPGASGLRPRPAPEADAATPDRGAFGRLVEEYADRLYNVALRITGDPADAEDSLQDAFLRAYRSWASFRGESSPTTWLYRIAVHAALARVRARRPVEYLTGREVDGDVDDWSDRLSDHAQRSEQRARILEGIGLLAPDLRAALVLRDVEGLSTAEAAAALQITEQALKSRLHRARALLRQHLAEYFRDR